MEWISVKDKLPENDERVIAFAKYCSLGENVVREMLFSAKSIIGSGRAAFFTGRSVSYLEDENITHWMPLPEPPKL